MSARRRWIAVAVLLLARSGGARDGAPPIDGDRWTPIQGELRVNGEPLSAAVAFTRDDPETAVEQIRAGFEPLPVDLVERALPDGRSLTVLDHHRGRTRVFWARRVEGGSEVIATDGARLALRPEADPDLPLPPGFVLLARLDDGRGERAQRTVGARCSGTAADALHAIDRAAVGAGFHRAWTDADGRLYARGSLRFAAAVSATGRCVASFRVYREEP